MKIKVDLNEFVKDYELENIIIGSVDTNDYLESIAQLAKEAISFNCKVLQLLLNKGVISKDEVINIADFYLEGGFKAIDIVNN